MVTAGLTERRRGGLLGCRGRRGGRARGWRREQLVRQPPLQKSSFNTFGEELVELPRTSRSMKQGSKSSDTLED